MSTAVRQQIIETGYQPRVLQSELHLALRRFNVIVCHRRFGKTVFCINHLVDRALRCTLPRPRFAYIAPNYGTAKRATWDYLKAYTANIPGVEVNEAELRIDIPSNGARIMLLSAENPNSLRGIYLDGVVMDEYADMNPSAWSQVVRPTLTDRRGWAIFIGTPKGQNNFFELREYARIGKDGVLDPDWFTATYRASETGLVDDEELASNRRTMTEEEFNQEYECDFNAGLKGAYFNKELALARAEKRITRVPYDPALPVATYWDLGLNDLCAVWFVQSLRGRHRIIDYLEISGASIPDVVSDVKKRNYVHGDWVFPHDVQARDFSTGRSQLEVFQSLGCRPNRVVPRVGTKRESINAARMAFRACEFDEVNCEKGLRALENYQRKFNEKNQTYDESPLHNWASNGADAFQCFAMGNRSDDRGSYMPNGQHSYDGRSPLVAETSYDPYDRNRQEA